MQKNIEVQVQQTKFRKENNAAYNNKDIANLQEAEALVLQFIR